jgi:hypothetical protein
LSIEMTTGMSAPPIGMMMSTPSTKAMPVITRNGGHCPPCGATKNARPKPSMARASARFSRCCALKTTGALEKRRE